MIFALLGIRITVLLDFEKRGVLNVGSCLCVIQFMEKRAVSKWWNSQRLRISRGFDSQN